MLSLLQLGEAEAEAEAWAGEDQLLSTVESAAGGGGEAQSDAEAALSKLLQTCQDAMDDVYRYTHELADRSKELRSNLSIFLQMS